MGVICPQGESRRKSPQKKKQNAKSLKNQDESREDHFDRSAGFILNEGILRFSGIGLFTRQKFSIPPLFPFSHGHDPCFFMP
jgi:hypothetical protein